MPVLSIFEAPNPLCSITKFRTKLCELFRDGRYSFFMLYYSYIGAMLLRHYAGAEAYRHNL